MLFRPNGPATNTFNGGLFIDLDVPPFENGRPDQRCQSGHIEDIAKWEIIGTSADQDVERSKLWNDWNAVRNERKINKIPLVSGLIVSLQARV